MDLNLDTLKHEIVEYLEHSEFAIFRSAPGGLEGLPLVLWDAERFPDYQMFLDAARKIGAKMILFASREFEAPEIDDAIEELDECDLTREERAMPVDVSALTPVPAKPGSRMQRLPGEVLQRYTV